jgi:hypothetical protein
MNKLKYIFKLNYVINHILFTFFITLFFYKMNDQS